MNIKQAKQEIIDTLHAYLAKDALGNYLIPSLRQRPVLLMGPPGIGKTQIMEQIASETGVGLVAYTITHHTRQSAIGLPFIEKEVFDGREVSVTEYTMSEILTSVYRLMKQTGLREGILFIDEINCVSETLAPMMLQFLQCKTFGNQKLPEGWLIVAAGNPPEYNRSVRDFDVVTLDRVKRIEVTEDFGVWKEYARRKGLHGAVISYLEIKKENFYRIENTPDGLQFATARGWEDLSELLLAYEKLGMKPGRQVVEQYIQMPSIAKDFANYLELYYKYQKTYQVEDILQGTWKPINMMELQAAPFDEKLSVIGLILSRLSESARETRRQEMLTDELHKRLVTLREALSDKNPQAAVQALEEETRQQLRRAEQAHQLEREERDLLQRLVQKLEMYSRRLGEQALTNGQEAMDAVRSWFAEERDLLDNLAAKTGSAFDNAFTALERALGQSQEMVIFVTEITAGYDTSWFVENYGCEAYFRCNQQLLFDDTAHRIREHLAAAKASGQKEELPGKGQRGT